MTGTNNSSYDRNTFFRLLSQLGTDSDPDPGGKMNLNYTNVDPVSGRIVPGAETNLLRPGQPQSFSPTPRFDCWRRRVIPLAIKRDPPISLSPIISRSVDRARRCWSPICTFQFIRRIITRRPFTEFCNSRPTSMMPPQITQRAAAFLMRPPCSVPRSLNQLGNKATRQVFITDYREVTPNDTAAVLATQPQDVANPTGAGIINNPSVVNLVYGFPLVVGAKKGLPNFNKLVGSTLFQVTRKLQFRRSGPDPTTSPVTQTNQMFLLGITNTFGLEAWNSYATNWNVMAPGRQLTLYALPDLSVMVTNRNPLTGIPYGLIVSNDTPQVVVTPPFINWPGYNGANPTVPGPSFQILAATNIAVQPAATYRDSTRSLIPLTGVFELNPPDGPFFLPQWDFDVKMHLRFAVVDTASKRLLDFAIVSEDISHQPHPGFWPKGRYAATPITPPAITGACGVQTVSAIQPLRLSG